ncbi:MAG: acetyl-CoA carboxylase carboxyltransferase subunit beta [Clostridia bacterium]|nr:acetyl-CoA carboxylase carboxyltransferase subunit beta [Clostridia bacterium]
MRKVKYKLVTEKIEKSNTKPDIPIGKWIKCDKCKEILYKEFVQQNLSVCTNCGNHFRLSSRRRVSQIIDDGTFEEFDLKIKNTNPIDFPGYPEKIKNLSAKTGLDEAVKCGVGKINSEKVVICVMDGNFLMGSMGSVVGEKITYSIEKAIELKLPIIIFCVSGGARMQEGIISLMQMAKTSAAVAKLNKAGNLYISVLTDPTYGGVTASFAMLGDIILAEPGARIGFAGPEVIKQTIHQELPDGFQTSEFLLEHGFVDKIVERKDMKETIHKLLLLNKGGNLNGK